ncbi:hypothetical protein N665_0172s0097 [Sinapis alba]|nr:hypothetical protein N665_0172s0097 [Sinapis alba]
MSHRLRSRASKQCSLIIGASSQIISKALAINSALSLHECVVLPPGSSRDAMPLEATLKIMSPLERIAADRIFQRNIFSVPPNP